MANSRFFKNEVIRSEKQRWLDENMQAIVGCVYKSAKEAHVSQSVADKIIDRFIKNYVDKNNLVMPLIKFG